MLRLDSAQIQSGPNREKESARGERHSYKTEATDSNSPSCNAALLKIREPGQLPLLFRQRALDPYRPYNSAG
jgi:hypothetical protein